MTGIADRPLDPHAPLEEIKASWPATIELAVGSEVIGISRSWGYELAARDEYPCRLIKVGSRRHRVVTASLVRLLETGVA